MNILQKATEEAGRRYIVQLVAAAAFGYVFGGWGVAFLATVGVLAVVSAIKTAAYCWTSTAEWVKLGITERYSAIATKKMEEAARKNLRETLDSIGQEALDEVEAAINRREEEDA